MPANNPQSADRSYKFIYKMLDIRFHRYLYHEGDSIEFIETEIADTGQRKDIVVKVDDDRIHLTEFMAKEYMTKNCTHYATTMNTPATTHNTKALMLKAQL